MSNQRVVVIDLDDTTDVETVSDSNDYELDYFEDPLDLSLDDISNGLNIEGNDLDINLIEEVIRSQDSQNSVQIIGQNYNLTKDQTKDEESVEVIKAYLKSDLNQWSLKQSLKKSKKSKKFVKSKPNKKLSEELSKQLINQLSEENKRLYKMVSHLRRQLQLKTYLNEKFNKSRSKNVCIKCQSIVNNLVINSNQLSPQSVEI